MENEMVSTYAAFYVLKKLLSWFSPKTFLPNLNEIDWYDIVYLIHQWFKVKVTKEKK